MVARMYKKVDKVELKDILAIQPDPTLLNLYANLHTKEELVSDILRHSPGQLTTGLRNHGWAFEVITNRAKTLTKGGR